MFWADRIAEEVVKTRGTGGPLVIRDEKTVSGRVHVGSRRQCVDHRGLSLGAIGGAGAVLSQFVKKLEVVAYEDLGTEAIRRLEVEGFPAIVLYDCHGGDLYQEGQKAYARAGA